jgi:hypothetical protein
MLNRVRHIVVPAILMAGSACLVGCGPKGPVLHPVEGQVLFMGQPAAGAQVVFHPKDANANAIASATVKPDGTFIVTTYPHGEGAQEGEYDVLITWFPENARELDNPQNKLPAKYARQGEAQLTATVKAGKNKLEPFRLTK